MTAAMAALQRRGGAIPLTAREMCDPLADEYLVGCSLGAERRGVVVTEQRQRGSAINVSTMGTDPKSPRGPACHARVRYRRRRPCAAALSALVAALTGLTACGAGVSSGSGASATSDAQTSGTQSTSQAASRVDVCSLLSTRDAADLLGAPSLTPRKEAQGPVLICYYDSTAGHGDQLAVALHSGDDAHQFFSNAVSTWGAQPVAGVGDEAAYTTQVNRTMIARSGRVVIFIGVATKYATEHPDQYHPTPPDQVDGKLRALMGTALASAGPG